MGFLHNIDCLVIRLLVIVKLLDKFTVYNKTTNYGICFKVDTVIFPLCRGDRRALALQKLCPLLSLLICINPFPHTVLCGEKFNFKTFINLRISSTLQGPVLEVSLKSCCLIFCRIRQYEIVIFSALLRVTVFRSYYTHKIYLLTLDFNFRYKTFGNFQKHNFHKSISVEAITIVLNCLN